MAETRIIDGNYFPPLGAVCYFCRFKQYKWGYRIYYDWAWPCLLQYFQ